MVAAKIVKWIRQNKAEFCLIFLILLLASLLRLYRISSYMTFLGDEGRDALAVKRIIVDHKLRLIGPVTSIGNMYLGPLYYYLITPAMFLSGLSPVGPAVFVALLGVATVGLVWWAGREFFSREAGMIAAALYAISPVVIVHSHSSWNPNVMPFFALLTIYGIWRLWQKHQYFWLPIMGIALSFAIQSHYLGLLLVPTIGIFWLATAKMLTFDLRRDKKTRKFILYSLSFILLFLLLTIVPLVWFDLRHNFINFNAFKQFLTVRQTTVNLKVYKAIPKLWDLNVQVFTRLLAGKDEFWGLWTVIGLVVGLILFPILQCIGKKKNGRKRFSNQEKALILLLVWFLVGLMGLGNYKQHIYDHYFGYIFPVPFLLTGLVVERIWNFRKIGRLLALAFFAFLVFLAFKETPLRYPPNNQLDRTKEIARFLIEKAEGEPFNLALIAERNYHDAYAYFMETWKTPATEIEPLRSKETITDQLFVICEKLPCEPINHPLAEIANFGWAKIEEKWELEGIEIYKLVHSQ